MKFAVAPMIDWTDIHCRYFYRLITKKSWLFTEMITSNAILFGDQERLLNFIDAENKTALQLGGNNSQDLAKSCKIAQKFGYAHINLNLGCPSSRVKEGAFGAVMMKDINTTKDCIKAMQDSTDLDVSIKHRIGVDEFDGYRYIANFINQLSSVGCKTFIIHARKAWLQGLSPKQNRDIPPLKYDVVYQLKKDFPDLNIIINGGIKTINQSKEHLQKVDGVMIGRGVYHNPYFLATLDQQIYNIKSSIKTREEILEEYIEYIIKNLAKKVPIRAMTRHILALYHATPNSKRFKRILSGKIVSIDDLINFLDE